MKSVYSTTMICNSNEGISIIKCPRFKKISVHVDDPPPPTLSQIFVEKEWYESLEWDNPSFPSLI